MTTTTAETISVSIHILDKEYRIACPEEEREALMASAHFLDQKMQEVRRSGKVIGMDRISIMAGLNIVHDLLQYKSQLDSLDDTLTPRLLTLQNKVERILEKSRQIEL